MNVNGRVSKIENTSEKYSLRPRRGEQRKLKIEHRDEFVTTGSNKPSNQQIGGNGKNTTKQKTAPLSKYRRKTANARERSRMREINLAFETLRKAVPSYVPRLICPGDGSNEKLTKITTLRVAMKYITGLTELLRRDDQSYVMDENIKYLDCYSTLFRDGKDTCTLTALNTSSNYDTFGPVNQDGGSDGESFHSGATLDNFIGQSIESLVPDLNLDFPDNLLNTELS